MLNMALYSIYIPSRRNWLRSFDYAASNGGNVPTLKTTHIAQMAQPFGPFRALEVCSILANKFNIASRILPHKYSTKLCAPTD